MEFPNTNELDFTEHWIKSIDKEVLRGIKVRDEKLKTHQSNSFYQYDVVDFDYSEPSCSRPYGPSQLKRPLNWKKNVNSHRSVSPHKIKKKIKKSKRNQRTRCGMRIAELAVPSKRHCLDTWRGKWNTLPMFMVDRLRQIVMDEKPIIPIQDAIDCFRQKQSKNSRSPCKGNKSVKNKKNKDIQTLTAIFGFRIAAQLAQPRNMTLGSRLIPISHVVSDEITRLLGKRKIGNLQKYIELEIANKITNWIADILEESTYNLMLEDYNELEKEEGHIWDIIDELVDNSVLLCKEPNISSSDAIDTESDLNPSFVNEETDEYEETDNFNSVDFENIISDIIQKITTSNDVQTQDTNVSREDLNDNNEISKTSSENNEAYFKNFLSNYINEIYKTVNDEEFEDAVHFDDSDSELIKKSIPDSIENTLPNTTEENKNEEIIEINNATNTNTNFNEYIDNIEDAFTKDFLKTVEESNSLGDSIDIMKDQFSLEKIPKEVSVSLSDKDASNSLSQDKEDMVKSHLNNETENIDNIIEEKNIQIDEIFPLRDTTSDDSLKKVKFSNMDSERGQLKSKSNFRVWENKKSGPQSIHFAPPNDNLLSNADESWPENLRFPTVKATVSISKSVLSLGNLNEDDEKNTDNGSVKDNLKSYHLGIDREIVTKNKALLEINRNNEQVVIDKLTNNDPSSGIEHFIETNNMETHIEVPKIFDKNTTLLKKNRNDDLTNNDPGYYIENVTEKNNGELNIEKLQTMMDNNLKRIIKPDVDRNIKNNEAPSVIEDIIKKNNEEVCMEIIQKLLDKVSLQIKNSNEHMINKNLTNRSIAKGVASLGVGCGSIKLKNKGIQTSHIINKKTSVILSLERLPGVFISPEIYKENILTLEALQKNETTRIRPDENCKYKENEVRIWCQGLQNVVQNLDMWLDWIDNTGNTLTYLKQKEKLSSCNKKIQKHNNHKLIKLKTNIDADAKLWENLSTRLQLGLRSYKYFPKQVETKLVDINSFVDRKYMDVLSVSVFLRLKRRWRTLYDFLILRFLILSQ